MNVETSNVVEYLSQSEILPIYTKSKNRGNFAALLVKQLVNKGTRVKSNVCGKRTEMLDPTILAYVKLKTLSVSYFMHVTYV